MVALLDRITSAGSTIALMYHALGVTEGPGVDPHYSVDLPRFSRHLELCARHGGAVVSARDWLAGRDGVIFTFDDGHETAYSAALPTLCAAGAGADFFVNPAQVGTLGFATWSQLRDMADAGMSIQSHGLDHSHYLTEISPQRLREELRQARAEIEQHIGQPVTLLSPPGGRRPRGFESIALEVGYTHVLDSRPASIRRGGWSRTLGRFAVTAQLDERTLEAWLRGGRARWKAQARYVALDVAKRTLGDRMYERVRQHLIGKVGS